MEPACGLNDQLARVQRDGDAFRIARQRIAVVIRGLRLEPAGLIQVVSLHRIEQFGLIGRVKVQPLAPHDLKQKAGQRIAVQAGGGDMRGHRSHPQLRWDEIFAVKEQRAEIRPHCLG